MSFWNIIIQWTSPHDLTEKTFLPKSPIKWWWWKRKLVKWQKFKTALCDLMEKLLPSNFMSWLWHNLRINLEANPWMDLDFFFQFYSMFCKLITFHPEWPQLATIWMSFDLSFGTKSKSLTFELKQAIHGKNNLTWKNRIKLI